MTLVAIVCPGPSLDAAGPIDADIIACVNHAVLAPAVPRVDWWHAHDYGRVDLGRSDLAALWSRPAPQIGIVRCQGIARLPLAWRDAGVMDVSADDWVIKPNLNWHFSGPTALWFQSALHRGATIAVYGVDLRGHGYASGLGRIDHDADPVGRRWEPEASCWADAAAKAAGNGCEVLWRGAWSPEPLTTPGRAGP